MFEEITDPSARVRALCDYGCRVDVDPTIPPKRYFRSGLEMLRMATVYLEEGNLESAFVLYSKFVSLFVEKLPKHPDYKASTKAERDVNKKKVQMVFPKAEAIKKKLIAIYSEQEKIRQKQELEQAAVLASKREQMKAEEEERKREEEMRRQDEERRKIEKEQEMLQEQETELQRLKDREQARVYEQMADADRRMQEEAAAAVAALSIASQIPPHNASPSGPSMPSRELKPPFANAVPVLPPSVDRSSKPSDHFTSSGALTGNKHGLRGVSIPGEIVVKFLNIALPNTSRNIETCGILCGRMRQNAFLISHLIIPQQTGTPDSCTTSKEEAVFDYQDNHDLITLGWIHTHPSQTAFLSSVDLHTHCSYQLMLPEAVAIVCAPQYQETGYFHLTDAGLDVVSKCRQSGFHPHQKEPPLFDTCPHVELSQSASITIVDLRN
ncbi:hypothetical protein CAPTEDRAFT_20376 [Capitella teleta]|uniref:MPN domain-containing protein n=1 Tax=Capitella teleta TaxID=283909 RepID=R7UEM3_CAPTE|nr:hypothetical protein CAPTEDRAFT_20376 [Capitella teleta]|eukprot:ELU02238.1 hypothetical protein CAPTEDRAFT_20376 [Capitella teleta]